MVQVLLGQRLRATIPYLLDPDLESPVRPLGLPNLSMVKAVRLAERSPTVVIGSVSTGVPNRVDDIGGSIDDLIADEQGRPNRGRFQQHVTDVVSRLRASGLISGREGGGRQRAARSAMGH